MNSPFLRVIFFISLLELFGYSAVWLPARADQADGDPCTGEHVNLLVCDRYSGGRFPKARDGYGDKRRARLPEGVAELGAQVNDIDFQTPDLNCSYQIDELGKGKTDDSDDPYTTLAKEDAMDVKKILVDEYRKAVPSIKGKALDSLSKAFEAFSKKEEIGDNLEVRVHYYFDQEPDTVELQILDKDTQRWHIQKMRLSPVTFQTVENGGLALAYRMALLDYRSYDLIVAGKTPPRRHYMARCIVSFSKKASGKQEKDQQ